MKTESLVRLLAGSVVLLGVALGHFVSAWWLLLACFAAVNLIPPTLLLTRLGWVDETGVIHWGGRPLRKD
jgi:hypothetical protein